MQGGRKGNSRERFAMGKINDLQESRRDQMTGSSDSPRYVFFQNPYGGSSTAEIKDVIIKTFVSDHLVSILTHKREFQDCAMLVMMKKAPK